MRKLGRARVPLAWAAPTLLLLLLGTVAVSRGSVGVPGPGDQPGQVRVATTTMATTAGCEEGAPTIAASCTIHVPLSPGVAPPTSATVITSDGHALAGEDYQALVGQVVGIPVGSTTIDFVVEIVSDLTCEWEEDFTATVSSRSGSFQVLVTIWDDDC